MAFSAVLGRTPQLGRSTLCSCRLTAKRSSSLFGYQRKPAATGLSGKRHAGQRNICSSASVVTREAVLTDHPFNNVTDNVFQKMGVNLHQRPDHPLCILKDAIYAYFDTQYPGIYNKFDDLYPVVSTRAAFKFALLGVSNELYLQNFDEVLVPEDHVSRNPNDTYYVDPNTVLRCHTSAHQAELLRKGEKAFLVTGDVYRRDSIDQSHYPVFHQMEGLYVYEPSEWEAKGLSGEKLADQDLKEVLEGLAKHLFGDVETRWVDAYFPFTDPSYELEIFFNDEWLEVLGCGVVQQKILEENGWQARKAWAFGLGLERLAMVKFAIPDIRYFWTQDPRFMKQFKAGDLSAKFKPYSKYPPCLKDVSFWLPEAGFTENNLCEVVRGVAGDLAESVTLVDQFVHPKTSRESNCFRITYRSMARSLTDEEINEMQTRVRDALVDTLKVELR